VFRDFFAFRTTRDMGLWDVAIRRDALGSAARGDGNCGGGWFSERAFKCSWSRRGTMLPSAARDLLDLMGMRDGRKSLVIGGDGWGKRGGFIDCVESILIYTCDKDKEHITARGSDRVYV
jgi:hypothetical protein